MTRTIRILGIRGIPAAHGGFETFAEKLALYLKDRGWKVIVYCQIRGDSRSSSIWNGVHLHHIPVNREGPLGTIIFDFKTILHSITRRDLVLTLGYNTAIFNILLRLFRIKNVINMDGIEWKRNKWSTPVKIWFYLNEIFGCLIGNHLIADHPEIAAHLARWGIRKKLTMIPYGADDISASDISILQQFNLQPNRYAIVIARPEPENSILEMVTAFSRRERGIKLLVLGNYDDENEYHREVRAIASREIVFPGAVYDRDVVNSLRYYARFYMHGHQVGGTNPSLVEAMGAGNAVLAHDNKFNRWVVDNGAYYFSSTESCEEMIKQMVSDDLLIKKLQMESRKRFRETFTWDTILRQYEELLCNL